MGAEDIFSRVKPMGDKLKKGPRVMKRKPVKVGVMNPYVFFQMVKPDFMGVLDTIELEDEAILDILNTHFIKNKQVKTPLSFAQLFDPKISPLYKPGKFKVPYALHPHTGHGSPNPDISRDARDNNTLAGMVYVKEPRQGKKSEITGDVIQGAAVNCYFHAALFSKVWTGWTGFPEAMNQIKFKGLVVNVTAKFLLGPNGKPVGAQLTPENEYWVCAYEKAYAEYCKLQKNNKPNATGTYPTPPYDPDILTFGQSDPLFTLSEITNLSYDFGDSTFGNPTAYDSSSNYASCYSILQDYNFGSSVGNSMITANPTVAWTKDAGPSYGPIAAIIPNHSYSILGTFRYGNPLVNYIVLRNPWAKSFSTTGYDKICQGGTYNPGLDLGIVLGPNSTKGIFALKDADFKTYFAGFGWVQELP